MKTFLAALSLAALAAVGSLTVSASPAAAVTLSNDPTGLDIGPFGSTATPTYGQVFVAPITGTLDSFTLSLNGGVGNIQGAVGTWNGPATHGFGYGSPTTLYTSAVTDSAGGGAFTFTPGISVTAGSVYVAFLTAFDIGNGTRTTMPRADALDGGGYFVWNNRTSPFGNGSWNYFRNFGSVLFTAEFSAVPAAVPLPAGGFLLIGALGGLAALRRRKMAA